MLRSILLGAGFAFAAGVQPGPLQAFLLSRATADGWKRTIPAALSPVLSDGPIALLVLLVVGRLPMAAQRGLRAAGGVLLLYLAWITIRSVRRADTSRADAARSGPRNLAQATMVNLLNPNPYLGWALVLGPAAVAAWSREHAQAVALIAAFYCTMVATLAAFIVLASGTRLLGRGPRRVLLFASGLVLAALGIIQLVGSARAVLSS